MVAGMIAAADTDQDGVVSFEEFVPMVRGQLGAAAPAAGWGQQSEEDILAQLLDDPASMQKYVPATSPHDNLAACLPACLPA